MNRHTRWDVGILLRYFMKTKNGLSVLYFTCKGFVCVGGKLGCFLILCSSGLLGTGDQCRHWGGAATELGCAGTSMKGHVPCLGDCCGTIPPPGWAENVGSLCLQEISKPVRVAVVVKLLQYWLSKKKNTGTWHGWKTEAKLRAGSPKGKVL